MRMRSVLQLCAGLAGLRLALSVDSPAPDAQVSVLSEGLLRLLSGVAENSRFVERQSRQATRELRRRDRELSHLRRWARQADRLWTGLKRELHVGAAREEGLWRGVLAFQGLTGWDMLEHRLARIQEIVQAIATPGAAKAMTLNITLIQAEMEAQGRRLSDLDVEAMIQDGLVAQQDLRIAELQASQTREEPWSFL